MTHNLRILFASYHCYLDPSSGAAGSTRDMLEMLAGRGWPVRVFCGPMLDHGPGERVEQIVSDLRIPFETKNLGTDRAEAVLNFAAGWHWLNATTRTKSVPPALPVPIDSQLQGFGGKAAHVWHFILLLPVSPTTSMRDTQQHWQSQSR